jgi:hypothetical protein
MTDYLVIQDAKTSQGSQVLFLKAGEIIRDNDFNITNLRNSGVALIEYDSATMATALSGFQSVEAALPLESMLPILTSEGVIPLNISSLTINGTTTVTAILDEDNMVSDRDDALATQQSIKAYADNITLPASQISIETTGSPTVDQVQEFIYTIGHAGHRSGGVITDAGGGTIDVALGEGMLRTTDSPIGVLRSISWAASAGITIPTDTIRHVFVEWNAGSPQIALRTSETTNWNTEFMLGSVTNEGGTLHILNNPQNLADFGGRLLEREYETEPFAYAARVGGLQLGETGTRYITLSAGELYDRGNEFDITSKDTSGTDSWDSYSSAGLEASAVQQWDNDNYDNAGTLTSLTANRWAVHWWYVESDDSIVMVYGVAQYVSAATAELESPPSMLPNRLQMHGKLIGRAIFQKGAGTYATIESALNGQFTPTLVTNHSNLSNLTADDHSQYALLLGRATGQTLIGGTASGDDLTLTATSHATPGNVIITDGTTITVASNQNQVGLAVAQNDTTNNPVAMTIANAGSGNSFVVDTNALVVDGAGDVSMAGDLDVDGHMAIGSNSVIPDSNKILYINEVSTAITPFSIIESTLLLNPSASAMI